MSDILTTSRCFRRICKDPEDGRRGVWIMTQPAGCRGIFFHGDRNEVQAPRYTVEDLSGLSSSESDRWFKVEEISPEELIDELSSWPEAQDQAIMIFDRHTKLEAK